MRHRGLFGGFTFFAACLLAGSMLFALPRPPASATPSQSAAPQQDSSQSPAPIRAVSRIVVLDTVVTDHSGEPVHGLQRGDFRVFEDGAEQQITNFGEVVANTQPAQSPPLKLPANTYTNYEEKPPSTAVNLLLLDALNTPMKDQAYVRQQMLKYLKDLPPGTHIAIFGLTSRLRIIQGFTSDSSVLVAALNSKKASPFTSPLLEDPNQESLSDQLSDSILPQDANGQLMLSNMQQFEADQAAFQDDMRIRITLDAFESIATYLSGIPGRKNVIWFSGSFPLALDPDATLNNAFSAMRNYQDEVRSAANQLTLAQVAVYPVDARGLMAPPMYSAANSGAKYARDSTAGTKENARFFQQTAAEQAAMREIAEITGGHAYLNTNGLREALASAISDGSNYYTISYVPSNNKWNGSFRKIELKPTTGNYHLAYRRGYYADDINAPHPHAANQPAGAKQVSMQRGAPGTTQILFDVRVTPTEPQPSPDSPRRGEINPKLKGPFRRYSIDYAVLGKDLAFSGEPNSVRHGSIDFTSICYDADGNVLNSFAQSATLNLPEAKYQSLRASALPFHQELDLPSGEVFLRVGVHDQLSAKSGSLEIPLIIPKHPSQEKQPTPPPPPH